jgi:hypothetical protein
MRLDKEEEDVWIHAMRRGNFARAWEISDAHLKQRLARGQARPECPRHLQPIWNGEPLAQKRVLVRCYHGLGDSIQFVRFLQPLRQIAHSVVLWVQPDLVALARTAGGADEVLALHDGTPEVDYDIDVEIMELPHALRISAIPANVPYLFVPRAAPPFAPDGHVNVGLVWAAGDWDEGRSLPLDEVKRIVGVPGIRLFSLQRGPRSAEASSIPILDCGSDEVIETATRMLALDLIVSVDTMAAHLAGALARPVWTLLQRNCDWRWPRDCRHSVWYPTMRLFHQKQQGDWGSAIEHLCAALQRGPQLGSADADGT